MSVIMEDINYSVIIRTTGKAGEKYKALLDSIDALVPKPKEVIVVLPKGCDEPSDKLSYETFYYSERGMVRQRMYGIEMCKTPYALICDDDISFSSDFVQKLYAPVKNGLGALSAGPLYSFLPPKGINAILNILMAAAAPTVFHRKDRYVSVLKSTGYSYNRHLDCENKKYYEAQSVAWTCFFADINALRKIRFEDEIYLDSHGYSALDDQAMFYKAWLNGYKTIIVSDAIYKHLDAKTSTKNNKKAALYSGSYNRYVFFHRYIYCVQKNAFLKGVSKIAFGYRVLMQSLFDRLNKTKEDYKVIANGYKDAKKYIKSDEYKQLPSIYTGGRGNK